MNFFIRPTSTIQISLKKMYGKYECNPRNKYLREGNAEIAKLSERSFVQKIINGLLNTDIAKLVNFNVSNQPVPLLLRTLDTRDSLVQTFRIPHLQISLTIRSSILQTTLIHFEPNVRFSGRVNERWKISYTFPFCFPTI